MVGIAGAEGLLEQFHAQRFDLVDVLRAGKPAIDLADVTLGGARADFSREQGAHGRAGGRFRRQQVDALLAAPRLVAFDGGNHGVLHLLAGAAGVEHSPRLRKDGRVVDFQGGIGNGCVWHGTFSRA